MLRLGTVPYLNALPLIEGLAEDPEVELVLDLPSRLAPRLRAGEVDLALVSAVELFRHPALSWLEGPAITSRGRVRSILLFLRTPVEAVRSVALDTSSLSAAAMTRVCLQELLGCPPPRLLDAPPDAPLATLDADAILRIGDPALRTDPGGRDVLDLGALWTERTGWPFVYALWLARPGLSPAVGAVLERARERGLARRDELASAFAARDGLDPELARVYLRESIGYDLDPDAREGLMLFGRLCHRLGLVDQAGLPAPLGDPDVVPPTR